MVTLQRSRLDDPEHSMQWEVSYHRRGRCEVEGKLLVRLLEGLLDKWSKFTAEAERKQNMDALFAEKVDTPYSVRIGGNNDSK